MVKANGQLTTATSKVTRAADEQAVGAAQLAKSAQRMRTLTQQTSASTGEQTRALGRMATQAREVSSGVQRSVQGERSQLLGGKTLRQLHAS